ncbi:tetratricopeptide repeat protein [Actinoplanes sp. NPDC051470]|uniref:tetratricopeptide repeat protein n=1 Tax=Actinoplanes sp. NPDC051470 TaxID=3157224 RepID=UPI0034363A84
MYDLAERESDERTMAACRLQFGLLANVRGDTREADAHYHWAVDLGSLAGDAAIVAAGRHQLGVQALRRGDHEEAEEIFHQGRAEAGDRRDFEVLAAAEHLIAVLAERRGRYDEADHWYRSAYANAEDGDFAAVAEMVRTGANVLALRRGDLDVIDRIDASLGRAIAAGDNAAAAAAYDQLGTIARSQGDYADADYQSKRLVVVVEKSSTPDASARLSYQFGVSAHARGDLAGAAVNYRNALCGAEMARHAAVTATGCRCSSPARTARGSEAATRT